MPCSVLDTGSIADYDLFLKVKSLPEYSVSGRQISWPAEYDAWLSGGQRALEQIDYDPPAWLFDYQRDIVRLALRKRKFAVFADCGLGKTAILLEFARKVAESLPADRAVLIVSPLMVIRQTLTEAARFYGGSLHIEHVPAAELGKWIEGGLTRRIGITNYEALKESLPRGRLGCLILDESSMLKSHYGKWGRQCLRLGAGLPYKLALTGTPAPNDHVEFANHAVFLDAALSVSSFLVKYFHNRGKTSNRWALKPHARQSFYRGLSRWSIFLVNPATYGWSDNVQTLPPINVHVHDVPLTAEQKRLADELRGGSGFVRRTALARLGKGFYDGRQVDSNKWGVMQDLVRSWPDESTLSWCLYNDEQDRLEAGFPDAASLTGATKYDVRQQHIADFQAGRRRVLISKPKILGFGLNLQIATRQIFSSIQDSYEQYYQAVKRSNRIGSTRPLNVHLPITELERPMMENVLEKAARVQQDTEIQEQLFREHLL